MSTLVRQRCILHGEREAVARCPECGQFYCRECITEHDDRVICTACLRRTSAATPKERKGSPALWRLLQAGGGTFMVWLVFYHLGKLLLLIPSSFHDGSVWERLEP